MISFKNKKILVSGASSGIGREVCISLSKLGAKVVLIARNEKELQKTISLMQGNIHKYFCFDLENTEKIEELIESCIDFDNIKLDGYVHSAGIPSVYPLRIVNYEKFKRTMDINTYSYLQIIKFFSKKTFSNDYSSVVYVSSILTKKANYKGQSLYIASKLASEGMSKSLSIELEKRKIRINSVICGGVRTNIDKKTQIYRSLSTENTKIDSIARYLTPLEVSNMILFLLHDCSKYIIGEDYYIDGGHI